MRLLKYWALGLAISFGIVRAHGSTLGYYTYKVNQFSLPCAEGSCTGNISLSGTITTDNTGKLSSSDIVVWDLLVSLNNGTPIELLQSNSGFGIAGAPLISATNSDLTITLNSTQDGFNFSGNSNAPAQWLYGGLSAPVQVLIYNDTSGNQYNAQQSFPLPATFTAAALSTVAAPEPASFLLVLAAGLTCLLASKKRANPSVACRSLFRLALLLFCASSIRAQDMRPPTEPIYPKTCWVLHAPLATTSDGPDVGGSQAEQATESKTQTATIQSQLWKCKKGWAVELATDRNNTLNAFLVGPIILPEDVSLIVDGGVTVYGSRDPALYQDKSGQTCGTLGKHAVNVGCKPLITMSSHTGIYGNGVIDAQGDKVMLGNKYHATWWDLTTFKAKAPKPDGTCKQPDPNSSEIVDGTTKDKSACEQSSPLVLSSDNLQNSDKKITNLTLYKVTVRNPPYHTTRLVGDDITVWGVKVQAPWNLPNTDGFDIRATNATFFDDTVANGDQEIAIVSSGGPTDHMTIDNFHGYGKGGITILGNGDATSHVLVENSQITGDLPSVVQTEVNGITEIVVNGVSFSQMQARHKLHSWGEALPNATDDMKALQITNQSSNDAPGSQISHVTFRSVCVSDIVKPIDISLSNSSPAGSVQDIVFQNVHVLKPSMQFPAMKKGVVSEPPAPGEPPPSGRYELFFDAPLKEGKPESTNEITFDNLVFDDVSDTENSIAAISAHGNEFTANMNAYPSVLYKLAQDKSSIDKTELKLAYNRYTPPRGISEAYLANACHRMPFIVGDLSLSTNQESAVVHAGDSVTLNAVVQPAMSQTPLFIKDSYGAKPGLFAIGSPVLTNAINFYEGFRLVGSAKLSANGTLASFTIPHLTPGVHAFRAEYPSDRYYHSFPFGLVTVAVAQP